MLYKSNCVSFNVNVGYRPSATIHEPSPSSKICAPQG